MTDEKQYYKNVVFNIKYLIRDELKYKQLLDIKDLLDEIIKDKEETGYTD